MKKTLVLFILLTWGMIACAADIATKPIVATEPKPEVASTTALKPYLGKWRPTSYREGLNIGSLTISVVRLKGSSQ